MEIVEGAEQLRGKGARERERERGSVGGREEERVWEGGREGGREIGSRRERESVGGRGGMDGENGRRSKGWTSEGETSGKWKDRDSFTTYIHVYCT